MTPAAIAKEIRKLHRQGAPLNLTAVKREHPELLAAAFVCKPFLGWKRALELAGLDYRSIRTELAEEIECKICGWSNQMLSTHLKSMHAISSEEYREEFPGAPLVNEVLVAKKSILRTKLAPHWEPLLSLEYIWDRTFFIRQQYGRCDFTFLLENDMSLPCWINHRGLRWDDVIRAIGHDPKEERRIPAAVKFSQEELLSYLRERYEKGLLHRSCDLNVGPAYMETKLAGAFGSLGAALEAAGLEEDEGPEMERRVKAAYPDRASVLAVVRRRAENGESLAIEHLGKEQRLFKLAVFQYFDNVAQCMSEAGLLRQYRSDLRRGIRNSGAPIVPLLHTFYGPYSSRESVVEALRERHRRGESLLSNAVAAENPSLRHAVICFFDSWFVGLHEAGLLADRDREVTAKVRADAVYATKEEALQALQQRHREGRGLSQDAVVKDDRPLKKAMYRFFGSWSSGVRAAGLEEAAAQAAQKPGRRGAYATEEAVIEALQGRAASGQSLVLRDVAKENNKLRYSAYRFYHRWEDLIKAAGLLEMYAQQNPRALAGYPDAEAILHALRKRQREGKSLSSAVIQKEDSLLRGAIYRIFGSFVKARQLAFPGGDAAGDDGGTVGEAPAGPGTDR